MCKKILLFLCLIFLICISSYKDSLADEYVVALPEFPEQPDGYEYYFIRKIDNLYFFYWIKNTYTYISNDKYWFSGQWVGHMWEVTDDVDNQEWGTPYGFTTGASDNTVICSVDTSIQDCNIIYSNFDIMYNDTLLRSKLEYNAETIGTSDEVTLSGIGGFFSTLFENLKNWFTNLRDTITNSIKTEVALVTAGIEIIKTLISELADNIVNGLKNLLEYLFVPDTKLFDELEEKYNEKFGAFFQIRDLLAEIIRIDLYQGTPHFEITYKDKTYEIIDFSMFDDYRQYITAISSFIIIFDTLMWLLRNAPTIISHGSADNGSLEITNHFPSRTSWKRFSI